MPRSTISIMTQCLAMINKLQQQLEMLAACHDAVIIYTIEGVITYWSQGAQRLYGWSDEDCMDLEIRALLKTRFPEPLESIMTQLMEQGYWQGELSQYSCHQQEITVLSRWALHRDLEGKPIAIVETEHVITEREPLEHKHQGNEAQLKDVAKNAPGLIYQFQLLPSGEMRFVYVSPFCQEIYEIEPDLARQDPQALFSLIHPDDQLAVQNSIAYCAETLEPWSSEHRIITPSGQQKWLLGASRPEKQSDGTILWNGMVVDISARKAVEAELAEREKQLRYLSENVPGMVYRYATHADGSNSFTYVSPRSYDIYGVSAESVMQNDVVLWQRIHPDDVLSFQESIADCIQTGSLLWASEYRIITPQGELRWIRAISQGTRQPNEDIIWDGFSEDISKRKLAEMKLQNQARREKLLNHITSLIRSSLDFNTILATTVEAIHDLLEADSCSFTWYRTSHHSWETVHQARTDEMPNLLAHNASANFEPLSDALLNLNEIVIDDITSAHSLSVQDALNGMACEALVCIPMQMASGEIGVISCQHCTPRQWTTDEIDLLRAVIGQLAIALTQAELYIQSQTKAKALEAALADLKRAQLQIIQTEKMSSLGQLVAGIAHEINNPVNFIYGNLSPAQDYSQDLLDLITLYQAHYPTPISAITHKIKAIELDYIREDLPKLLASMQMGADRIASIVSSLRTFSHLDESDYKAVNIHEGLDSALVILESRLKSCANYAGIKVIKQYSKLPLIECYAGQLNQVFMNILVNAIDALEARAVSANSRSERGQGLINSDAVLATDPSTIVIRTELIASERVAIWIIDNGIGMSEEVRHRIFDPFFTTKPVGKGTGMGLSMSYQIVTEKHKGSLKCISAVGQGTTFVIEIPL
jgi:two-component system, NtrC family, sensor kinase